MLVCLYMLFWNKRLVTYGYIECVDLWLLYRSGPRQACWRPIRPSIIKSLPTPALQSLAFEILFIIFITQLSCMLYASLDILSENTAVHIVFILSSWVHFNCAVLAVCCRVCSWRNSHYSWNGVYCLFQPDLNGGALSTALTCSESVLSPLMLYISPQIKLYVS